MNGTRSLPVDDAARIDSLDALRGVAVLGILVMNVVGFGLPGAYFDPSVAGGDTGADLATWATSTVLLEGTMRGLFTLLFGAGVVLFTTRAEQADPAGAADLHVRRMLWLVAFGFVNSHVLLWSGDILYEYGIVGLVLYAFRKARPRTLVAIALVVFAFLIGRGVLDVRDPEDLQAQAAAATALQAGGATLTPEQQQHVEDWKEKLEELHPPEAKLREQIDAMRGTYPAAWAFVTEHIKFFRTIFFYDYGFLEDFASMLLGIALFATGALQGRWSARRYALLALLGYASGLAPRVLGALVVYRADFEPITMQWVFTAAYEIGRVPLTLGHLGLVLLLWRTGLVAGAMRTLAAVGRMAFTNYLAQSLICTFLFTGVGLGLFGQLRRHELYYVVLAIWIAQLAWSPWWLARFRYGPLEWLWRSLTYRRWQPLRRAARAEAAAGTG